MKVIKSTKYIKLAQFAEDVSQNPYQDVEPDIEQPPEGVIPQNESRQWVSVYKVERAYGGAEEGGWWYDVLELIDSKPVATRTAAEIMRTFLEEKYKGQNEETGPMGSSKGFENLPEGTEDYQIPLGFSGGASEIVVILEDEPGENTTTERPHYE